jgi:hypothetical protein
MAKRAMLERTRKVLIIKGMFYKSLHSLIKRVKKMGGEVINPGQIGVNDGCISLSFALTYNLNALSLWGRAVGPIPRALTVRSLMPIFQGQPDKTAG